jgi:lipopolysaccharide assembly protein A
MQIFLFFALIIAVLAVFFALQNSDPVTVKFAVWDFNSSLAFVLLLALLAGALISFFFSLPSNLKARWTIRQQRKKLNENETSLAQVKAKLEETETKMVAQQSPPQEKGVEAVEIAAPEPTNQK